MSVNKVKKANFYLVCLMMFFILIRWRFLPPEIPLFYSRPWGQDQLAQKVLIFILPGISILIFLVNNYLANQFNKSGRKFLSDTAVVSAFITSLLLIISLLNILKLVT